MKKKKKVEHVVYLDGTDFKYEIGHASDGNKVYPSLDCLKKYSPCWEECGVVECKLTLEEWVVPENWELSMKNSVSCSVEDLEKKHDIIQLEAGKKHLAYLEELVKKAKNKVSIFEKKVNEGK